jgi:hypothetical protein
MVWDRNTQCSALGIVLPIGYVAASWQNATVDEFQDMIINGNPTGNFSKY